ncbi:3-keto-disaccharide hydrolase [Tautonia sociabilis]|uniref:DUF1080 domain-containing protein n=1 Tax=Tautonia sociabilis TaxID=2080755 RepID=A0A432MF86_9BACT|nr:DUF1080 domain-containing protein [Tautonia sociabilis]RUL84644.1 DUF1080 domain-containing protein [Tautonia sociabilis]
MHPRRRSIRSIALGLIAAALGAPAALALAADEAIDVTEGGEAIVLLHEGDLENWTVFVDPRTEPYSPESSTEGIFTVEDGVLHVTGERFACLTTTDAYQNYRLVLEFKWGETRWPPRAEAKRDSGVLLHCVGPDRIWTKSIECQIQEGDCGDFYMVGGTSLTVGGKAQTGGRFVKTTDAEKPNGEWNTIEVVCDGDRIVNIVNGTVVNEGTASSETAGRILLQSEGAEVFYRNVKLLPLDR